ncbi:ThiF family adenylyltransferase [Congregibacter litoralis]|uniref:Dinucleotide-utilizing enzyme involved in molybdopterin and thiamine biosynthesis family 2 n=1 Tax=Congregibacter litoralis KT71 TaxID=314285 RepID=A4A577_9GAMM|nr:ThiF family adenylyltransferase [Congregibacter litoralis]EAQ98948.1 Dinucleotide-utilizing enzyme involved in molybdopterin and thiamine biosynthesis family 2 [Congregibacter litoralis KT71]
MEKQFDYEDAFSRNIGWLSLEEQQLLRNKRIAIAGMGGVGGDHAVRMARLGAGRFTISDLDVFEQANFNRQYGATMDTVDQTKVEVMEKLLLSINPEADIRNFPDGVSDENVDDFLAGADLYIDSLDFFALDIRRTVFRRCRELGIPAITAAPMGMGTALLVFTPDSISFDDYFDFDSVESWEDKMIKFLIGLSPSMQQRHYLVGDSAIDFNTRKVPSTGLGISLAAGVACTTAVKLLLGRGPIVTAPSGLHFDAYRNKYVKTWRPGGNRNPLQRIMFMVVRTILKKQQRST